MVYYEQAALLATAWANDPHVSSMAGKHCIVVPPAKNSTKKSKVTRGYLFHQFTGLVCFVCLCVLVYVWFFTHESGDLKANAQVIGLACKHVGCRPSIAIMEQAAHAFFSMKLPRDIPLCSTMFATVYVDYLGMCISDFFEIH